MPPMKTPEKFLIVITGPTASGKSGLSIQLAKHLQTEIISADSRQVYKELNIGTAKVTQEEMQGVPHHLISNHSVLEKYNAAIFEQEALDAIECVHQRNNFVIMTGGTGLYIDAVCRGINDQLPGLNSHIRDALQHYVDKMGLESLYEIYRELDEEGAVQVDAKNTERLIRATSACIQLGKPFSMVKPSKPKQRPFKVLYFVLDVPREELYERINMRVEEMMNNGLLEEVNQLKKHAQVSALRTVGYAELIQYLNGEIPLDEAIELIKRNTRRYAKRQLTWFRKYENAIWVKPDNFESILTRIEAEIYR